VPIAPLAVEPTLQQMTRDLKLDGTPSAHLNDLRRIWLFYEIFIEKFARDAKSVLDRYMAASIDLTIRAPYLSVMCCVLQ